MDKTFEFVLLRRVIRKIDGESLSGSQKTIRTIITRNAPLLMILFFFVVGVGVWIVETRFGRGFKALCSTGTDSDSIRDKRKTR